jgi:hypothetical protein
VHSKILKEKVLKHTKVNTQVEFFRNIFKIHKKLQTIKKLLLPLTGQINPQFKFKTFIFEL